MNSSFKGMASNGPMTELDFANSLTIDDLILMMPEIEAKFPKRRCRPIRQMSTPRHSQRL